MSAHTPGPWKVKELVGYIAPGSVILRRDDSKAGLHMRRLDTAGIFTAENARLIAAAPELLEACMEVANGYSTRGSEMARAAIAKATGK